MCPPFKGGVGVFVYAEQIVANANSILRSVEVESFESFVVRRSEGKQSGDD